MNDYLRGYLDGIRDERERRAEEIQRVLADMFRKLGQLRQTRPAKPPEVPSYVPDEWTEETK